MTDLRKRKTMKIKFTASSEVFAFFHDYLGFEYIDDFLEVLIRDSKDFSEYLEEKDGRP